MLREPPDILITTPESLYLLLTSQARELLRDGRDGDRRRGARRRGHEARRAPRALARAARARSPTRRSSASASRRRSGRSRRSAASCRGGRPIELVDAGVAKELDLEVVVAGRGHARARLDRALPQPRTSGDGVRSRPGSRPATGRSGRRSIPALLELVRAHRSTIVFVNNRRLAERLALRLNELAGEELARAHHGSLAREQRVADRGGPEGGAHPGLVATSSLELGIDMGAVDLVIQVESPKSVARGLQRIGRAGHTLGAVSKGRIFPKFRADLLECAVVAQRDARGRDRGDADPAQPARRARAADRRDLRATRRSRSTSCTALVRGAYPFADLSRAQLENVLDMLAGRYPSDEFAELRPRIVWDRTAGVVRGREGARRLAVTNAGTIPDRGLFGVFLADGGGRVGELDEEMVYEARAGQVFLLGASTWRIEEITRDRVLVSPAPGRARHGAVLEGRGRRPPVRARRGDRQVLARAARAADEAPHGCASRPRRRAPRGTCVDVPRASRSARPASSRPTARSSSSASATRSATGASASSRRSARACTRRGRWRSARACATRSASRCSRSGRTTASRSTSPDADAPPATDAAAARRPTSSRSSSSPRSGRRRSSARASARTRRARC